jgi:hypothetical protein
MVALFHKLFRRLRPVLVAVAVLSYGMAAIDLACAGHFSDLTQSSLAWSADADSGAPLGKDLGLGQHSHCGHFNGLSGGQMVTLIDVLSLTRVVLGRDQFLAYLVSQRPDEPPRAI